MIQSIKGIVFSLVFLVSSMNADFTQIGILDITEEVTEVTGPTEDNPVTAVVDGFVRKLWCQNSQVGDTDTYSTSISVNNVTKEAIVDGEVIVPQYFSYIKRNKFTYIKFNEETVESFNDGPSNSYEFKETVYIEFKSYSHTPYKETFIQTNKFIEAPLSATCTTTTVSTGVYRVETPPPSMVNIILNMIRGLVTPSINNDRSTGVKTKTIVLGVRG